MVAADGRYAHAGAVTQAERHHEDLCFGAAPAGAVPPPLLYLSCTYIPLMPGGGYRADDPAGPGGCAYYAEYYFLPRVAYDGFAAEGPWSLVGFLGWHLHAASAGEGLDVGWTVGGWNPPHDSAYLWDSPIDAGDHLYGLVNRYFRTSRGVFDKIVGADNGELAPGFELGAYQGGDAHEAALPHMADQLADAYAAGRLPVCASSVFRIGPSGDPDTDRWRTVVGEACDSLARAHPAGWSGGRLSRRPPLLRCRPVGGKASGLRQWAAGLLGPEARRERRAAHAPPR